MAISIASFAAPPIDGDVPVSVDGRRSVTRVKTSKPQTAKAA